MAIGTETNCRDLADCSANAGVRIVPRRRYRRGSSSASRLLAQNVDFDGRVGRLAARPHKQDSGIDS